jgi:glutamine amidotransferase
MRWASGRSAVGPTTPVTAEHPGGQWPLAPPTNDTLSILRRDDGLVLTSEPYDDQPGWEDVPTATSSKSPPSTSR